MFGGGTSHYNPDEPRDERGRWTSGGGSAVATPPLFNLKSGKRVAQLGVRAAGAVRQARGAATFVASLPVIPKPKPAPGTGALPGLGHYFWDPGHGLLELTGWDGSRVVAAQGPKDIFYALPKGIPHPIAQVLGDTLVVDPVRLTAVRSLLERTSSDGDDSEGDDNDDDDDDDDGSPAASERIGGGRHHAPLVTREAASSLRFGAPTQNGYRWLGLLAMGALGHADGRPTSVASLPVLPWPDRPVATGTLPGLGTYRWNRDLGILKLTTTNGQDVVADHGPNDLFYVFYDGDYHPIGQILEGRALVIDPELLDDAESALGRNRSKWVQLASADDEEDDADYQSPSKNGSNNDIAVKLVKLYFESLSYFPLDLVNQSLTVITGICSKKAVTKDELVVAILQALLNASPYLPLKLAGQLFKLVRAIRLKSQPIPLPPPPLTPEQIAAIQATPKGLRPNPTEYLPPEYIAEHHEQFASGASRFMPRSNLEQFGIGQKDGTSFVMPSQEADALIAATKGNPRALEKALGLPENSLSKEELVRVDISNPWDFGLRIPSGNEAGANAQWIPGGRLPTGNTEAVIDGANVPQTALKVTPIKP